jgi:SAM-dependent methyltransferase
LCSNVTDSLPHDLDAMAETDAYNAWLVDRAKPWIRGRVLDVGAGIGTHARRLVELADEVVALEPEAELATLLRAEAPAATVVEGDAWSVDGPFDAIVCFNVLEHIPDDRAVIARFDELLAPGGAVCLIVPAHPALFGPLDESFGHERRYTRGELRDKLVSAGLEPVTLRHVNPAGAAGWFVQSRILRRTSLPRDGLSLYDRLVPAFRAIDRVPTPVGLSLWAVAKTTGIASASATNA